MRLPKSPPETQDYMTRFVQDESFRDTMRSFRDAPSTVKGKYLHWDELIRREPPENLSHESWWVVLKNRRRSLYKTLPCADKHGVRFVYADVEPIPHTLHRIDLRAGGIIEMPPEITTEETKDRYYVNSLIEEAITSSQLEGANTTRLVAEDMIRSGRAPINLSEQMVLNNFNAMKAIEDLKNEPLSKELVFELHRIVTGNTLDDPGAAGRFRKDSEKIVIMNERDDILHSPPPSSELDLRMKRMCSFANGESDTQFIHPVIRSIALHFWLAYDHPFVDGNGRTARALMYWSMLRNKYWMFEFLSVSSIILKAPSKYQRAFLYTETDENDLTYFILYNLDTIDRAIAALQEYIHRKSGEVQAVERFIRQGVSLNYRQRALITHALRRPNHIYTIESHRRSHNVVYQTARTDLLDLSERGFLKAWREGRKWHFTPEENLEHRLAQPPKTR